MRADLRITNYELRFAGAYRLVFVVFVLFVPFGIARAFAADDFGFGPPISVPRDLPQAPHELPPRNWIDQTAEEAMHKSQGCLECHKGIENPSMHVSQNVVLGCTDCHGGNPTPGLTQTKAHILPLHPEYWPTSPNPADADVLLNHESPEFIQFVNPGDLRVVQKTCVVCHQQAVEHVW